MGDIGKNGSTTQSSWTKKVTVFLTKHSCLGTQHNNAWIVGSIKIWMWSNQNGTKPNKTCNPYGDTVNEIRLIAFQVGCQASKIGAASCSSMILIDLGSTAQDVQASFPSFAGQLPKLVLLHIPELPTKNYASSSSSSRWFFHWLNPHFCCSKPNHPWCLRPPELPHCTFMALAGWSTACGTATRGTPAPADITIGSTNCYLLSTWIHIYICNYCIYI